MAWKPLVVAATLMTVPVASNAQTVTVRTYNNYGVSAADLAAARPHVESVFARTGIEVSWIDCWYRDQEVAGAAAACRQPLKPNELILRLQGASPLPGKRLVSMGFALVNTPEGVPFLATIFADLVRSVSRDTHLDFSLLLGRAIAHEIGHLLLDNNRHAERGLMRGGWSHVELRQNAESDWTFAADEAAVILTAAALRASAALRAGN